MMNLDRLTSALSDRYRLERELGAGGMATVYLAQDLKHDRQVALKVLRPELAAVIGAERFLHEIKTTANLQHPHILPLFDSGTVDGTVFYVMPFVAGETLRDRLTHEKQLSIDDAIRITREVASALDYAHRHGVIHRDIKPENILLHDGQALVADFGIALAASSAGGSRMTETGMSLGTPHYMSPEQAMGEREITARSDVYALGCVTYEMLTGDPPFTGSTAQAIVAQVITEDPRPPSARRKTIPPAVEDAVLTALAKLPADRFASAAEFSAALAGEGGPGRGPATRRIAAGHVARRPSGQPALLVVALLLTAVAAWGWLRPTPAPPVIRYGLALPASQAPVIGAAAPTPSPDGSFLVYVGPGDGGNQLWIKRRDRYEATPIAGTMGSQSFTLSPDGESVAFIVNGRLSKIPMGGGPPVLLTSEDVSGQFGLAWLDDGTIIYPMRAAAGLRRVSAEGGAAEAVWRSDSLVAMLPSALPDGRGVLFVSCLPGCVEGQLWALDLEANNAHPVVRGASEGVVVRSGHLVYKADDGGLFASAFDLGRLQISGAPIPLGDQLASNVGNQLFRISASGTLVMYAGGSAVTGRTFDMVWVDQNGRETPVDTAWTFQLTATANNHGWALSPDGSRLAIGVSTPAGDDIWVKPLPTGAAYRVTFDPLPDSRPRWTSDGRYITFRSDRRPSGLYWRRADGSGADSLLVEGIVDEGMITPDNRWIVLRQGSVGQVAGGRNITGVRIGTDSTPRPVLATEFDEMAMAFSPDGRWMAYQSDETGQTEVFVRPFPDTDAGKTQVSSGGGLAPVWSRDGRQLFYLSASRHMMAAPVAPGPALVVGAPEALFRVRDELLGAEALYYAPWDIARDGRFLMARLIGGDPGREASLVVVENWIEELKVKVKR